MVGGKIGGAGTTVVAIHRLQGRWSKAGGRAGGCLNHPATFLDNPQLCFDLSSKEEVIIQLSQITDKAKVLARLVYTKRSLERF